MSAALLQIATVVEWDALGETALAALVAGTAFTLAWSLGIAGTARAAEARRENKPVEAAVAGAVGGLAFVVSVGLVVVGLIVMAS
jgi:hypothetical protein